MTLDQICLLVSQTRCREKTPFDSRDVIATLLYARYLDSRLVATVTIYKTCVERCPVTYSVLCTPSSIQNGRLGL